MKSEQKLNILFVEDLPADAELAQRELRKAKLKFFPRVVDTERSFREALEEHEPNIVISDYSMPSFDGMSALKITRECSEYIPFIMLTGSINEETAVKCMKAGANDYVLKEQIKRLPFAVIEAIKRNRIRIDKEIMENKLRQSEARFKTIMASIQDTVFTLDRQQRYTGVYGPWVEQQGFTPDDFLGKTAHEIMGKDAASIHEQANEQALKGEFVVYEWSAPSDNGTLFYQTSLSPIFGKKGKVEGLVGIGRDITELKQAEEKLKLLSHSIEQSPVSIIITDKGGKIEYVNPAFCDHTGYRAEEVIGENPRILNSGHHPISFFTDLWNTILSKKDWRNEIKNKKKNGKLFWENVVISPILNEKNEIVHFTSIREDITEKKEMIKDLVREKENAEMSDKLKSVFLANMSHEIRTPMNGIMGFIDLLQKQDLNKDTQMNYLGIVHKSSLRLLNTLNDIIEISRIEAGQISLLEERFHLSKVLRYFYDFHKLEARNKGLTFRLKNTLPPDTDLIKTDKHKMESILDNFIKNAIKFTSEGFIEIGSEIRSGDLTVYVRDTGSGIPADRLESIFERFVQADLTITKAYEGSGLGLAISRAYADMIGGKIGVESHVGEGSVFTLTLPLRQCRTQSPKNGTEKKDLLSLDKILKEHTVLLVEDDASSILYMEAIFKNSCKNLLVAETGMHAIETARNNPDIDLILMDIKMPDMNGFTATEKIREFNKGVIIIAQTAYAMENDMQKALDAGCNGYISKPIYEEKLILLIKNLLRETGKDN